MSRRSPRVEDLERVVDAHLQRAPAPATAVSVAGLDGSLVSRLHGTADLTRAEPVTPEHWWDLASLTKTLLTLPVVLDMHRVGALDLDAPVGQQWVPLRETAVARASVADLISYRAGQPATARLWEQPTMSRRDLVRSVADLPLDHPGTARYSDLGFLLVGEMVATLAGVSLPTLAADTGPLRFGPLRGSAAVVATEDCPWRGHLLRGSVHDENAEVLGGAAGHAGAFGTLAGVTEVCVRWLRRAVSGEPLATRATVEQSRGPHEERYGLGWWLPPTRSLGGSSPGPGSFGMSGFVGTRVWFEPGRRYVVVVLSNRVHPARGDRAPFDLWCQDLLDAVAEIARP